MPVDVESFYRTYAPLVLGRCRRLLRHEERAVDAMHDTFVQVLRSAHTLSDDSPSSLLLRMATHVCLNQLRHQRRHPEHEEDSLLMEIAKVDIPEDRSIARSLLRRMFAREQPSTRALAVMHWVDGMTLEEVAQESGLSVSGVRKRLRVLSQRVAAMPEMQE